MTRRELFGTPDCPYTRDMREWLEMRGAELIEYDVEADGRPGSGCARWPAPSGARQTTTGTVGHLEAAMVEGALDGWALDQLDFLFIENVTKAGGGMSAYLGLLEAGLLAVRGAAAVGAS